jgi:PAS domain S-box-containing protein
LAIANLIGATLERKERTNGSQESEERFRYLFAQASIGIAIETIEGRILDVNPAFCAMIGYSLDELRSLNCSRISHPDDEKLEEVLFEELRRGIRASYRIEKRFFQKDGSQMWGLVSVSLLDTNHGTAPLVIAMVTDVTAQKASKASLEQRDQELQQLARRLIEAQEEERCRISRELHDDIGQRLALLAIEVDSLRLLGQAGRIRRHAAAENAQRAGYDRYRYHGLSHELPPRACNLPGSNWPSRISAGDI